MMMRVILKMKKHHRKVALNETRMMMTSSTPQMRTIIYYYYYYYYSRKCVIFLGFHPYKEVIFLGVEDNLWVACHFDSGKVQYLGELNPGTYNQGPCEAFVYTPCKIGV